MIKENNMIKRKSTPTNKKSGATKKKASSKIKKSKTKKVSFIPKGYHCITPYLIVDNATKAIAFYKKIFGAKEIMRMDRPDGKIGHAELKIGDAKIMLADECPEMKAHSPKGPHSGGISIHTYVKDVDATIKKAVTAGAKLTRKAEDMFYGDRSGSLRDPYGHHWFVSTHIEDVSKMQLKKRAAELFGKKSKK